MEQLETSTSRRSTHVGTSLLDGITFVFNKETIRRPVL